MTLDDVKKWVGVIRENRESDDVAHREEDLLYERVLEMIMEDSTEPSIVALAGEALKTKDIEFSRWYG